MIKWFVILLSFFLTQNSLAMSEMDAKAACAEAKTYFSKFTNSDSMVGQSNIHGSPSDFRPWVFEQSKLIIDEILVSQCNNIDPSKINEEAQQLQDNCTSRCASFITNRENIVAVEKASGLNLDHPLLYKSGKGRMYCAPQCKLYGTYFRGFMKGFGNSAKLCATSEGDSVTRLGTTTE